MKLTIRRETPVARTARALQLEGSLSPPDTGTMIMARDPERRRQWYRKRYRSTIAAQRKAAYESHKSNGVCPNCTIRPATDGTLLCDPCRETRRRVSNAYYANVRQEVFAAYGGPVCTCCGETEESFLSIDHVNGSGNEHRRQIKNQGGSSNFYVWLKKNKFPTAFQVLCMNCNHGRMRNGGVCPHQQHPGASDEDRVEEVR